MDKEKIIHIGAELAVLTALIVYIMNENTKLRKEITEIKKDVQTTAQRIQHVEISHGNEISNEPTFFIISNCPGVS